MIRRNQLPQPIRFRVDEQHRKDSIKMQELALQLQEMKLNEILLKDELESTKNSNATADSLKGPSNETVSIPFGH